MTTAAEAMGVSAGVLSVRGRVGAARAVDPEVAASMLGIIAPRLVRLACARGRRLSAAAAAMEYASVCADWGNTRLADSGDPAAVAARAEAVLDAADVSDLPLAAAWRWWPRPEEPRARLAHALMLLAELRHGLYLAALQAHELDVDVALVTFDGGSALLKRLGWPKPEIDAAEKDAAAMPDLAERRDAAEHAIDVAFSTCLDVLDVPGQRILVDGIARADQATNLL